MSGTGGIELLHIEELDERGRPTGHARCDQGDGTFPGVLLAVNSGTATCEACIEWEPDETPAPKHGDHGTCATCGGEIEYYEAATYNGDVLDSWWSHRTHPADNHDAQLGGPA